MIDPGEKASALGCTACQWGTMLFDFEICDVCGYEAPGTDKSVCPYFRRYAGWEGHDPKGTCSFGCRDEPSCVTDRPIEGWPAEVALTGRTEAKTDG